MLQDALEHLVRGIVDYPEDVQVDLRENRRGELLEVRVNPDDLGRVIGRKGRTANALRAVVDGLAGYSVRVDVVDTDRRH
ncbi:RNA-binding protein [Auritidibacter ignavus]|uniref:RNA-binding protein n=1 Tax=Auritidibacter ignavus TaxID=678932 RepID=UPI00109C5570|nr:RNA-binding protein [Auritidibacter ignavus]